MEVSSIRAEEMSDDETFDDAYDNHVSCRGRVPRGGLSPLSSSSDTHLSPSEDESAAHENIVKSFNKPHSRKKKSKRPSVTPTFGVSSTSTANNANQDLMQDIIKVQTKHVMIAWHAKGRGVPGGATQNVQEIKSIFRGVGKRFGDFERGFIIPEWIGMKIST